MVKLYKNFNIKNIHKNSIILIGNFDGVHLGHQKLFKLANSYKKKYKLKIGVVNFDPMPKMFFNRSLKNFRITSISQKVDLLSKLKVDFIITKKFDKLFSKTKSINFIKEILYKKLKSKFHTFLNSEILSNVSSETNKKVYPYSSSISSAFLIPGISFIHGAHHVAQ